MQSVAILTYGHNAKLLLYPFMATVSIQRGISNTSFLLYELPSMLSI